jgi:hypothetical protein
MAELVSSEEMVLRWVSYDVLAFAIAGSLALAGAAAVVNRRRPQGDVAWAGRPLKDLAARDARPSFPARQATPCAGPFRGLVCFPRAEHL